MDGLPVLAPGVALRLQWTAYADLLAQRVWLWLYLPRGLPADAEHGACMAMPTTGRRRWA